MRRVIMNQAEDKVDSSHQVAEQSRQNGHDARILDSRKRVSAVPIRTTSSVA